MRLVEVYDRNAGYWDSWLYRKAYLGAYADLFRALIREGVLGRPARVLDCGAGAGLFSESLLDVADWPIELHGVDLSSKLLGIAKAKSDRRGAGAELAAGDITRLPYRNGQMDLVLSALVLEHVPHPVDAVREMMRVLRSGRLLALVATRRGAPDHFFRVKYRYRPYSKAAVLAWMRQAGLVAVQPRSLSGIARFFARAYTGVKA
jgi:demethylmenaquinone methyltransferase/2-methoxy-6-polyprenyl-1,4-benzoquinol methylase